MIRLSRSAVARIALLAGALAAPPLAAEDALVTPVRVGRPDAPLVLRVWAQQDYSHLAARPGIARVFHDVFEAWARAHPGVRLEISVMPALEMHKAKLLLAAAADRLPDIASVDSFWMPLFLEGHHAQPLDPYWPAADRADYVPFAIDALSDKEGHVYGVWHGTDCRMLYYRKDLVPAPPKTWDELLETASRIAREKRIAGYLYNAGRWEAAVFDHLGMFWGQGGRLVDDGGRPLFGEPPHREKMLRVLRFLHDTVATGASPRAVLGHNDYQQLTSAAIAGDAAMFLGGNWQLRDLQSGLSPAEFAKWDVAPIPQAPGARETTGTGGWVWVMFSRDPERQRASAEFLQFVESAASSGRILEQTGQLPVRRSHYRDLAFFRQDPWYVKFGEMVAHGQARPGVPLYPAISEQLQLAVGYAVSGDKTPEQALDEAWAAVQKEAARPRAAPARPSVDAVAVLPVALVAVAAGALVWPRRGGAGPGWLAPALVVIAALVAFPMLDLVRLSFTNTRTHGLGYAYTMESYRGVLGDPAFLGMVGVTLVFLVTSVGLQMGLGLAIAVLLDAARRHRAPLTLAARIAVVSAWIIPGVLVGVLWRILLIENRSGIVNYWLSLAGEGPLPLVSSGPLALASLIAANGWRGCAFSMILLFAGLQRIPRERHEAADLEGVGAWARFRVVLLPPLKPVLALNLALVTIQTLNTFDLILPLTGGGPARRTEVISLFMYRSAFANLEAGRAAAVAVVLLALNLALALLAARLIQRGRTT
jgi:multiple sugar transport system substrate-binding protein